MGVSSIDAQDPAEMGEFESIFSSFCVLFEVSGQAPIPVRACPEGGFDAPAQRQGGKALGLRIACGNLELDLVPASGGVHRGACVDRVDLDAVKMKPVLDGPVQEKISRPGIMDVGRGDHDRQNEAERAGQDMALDALDLLVAVEPPLTLLRTRDDALRIHDPGRRLRGMAVSFAHPPRQLGSRVGPHAVGPEPVMPRAHRRPRAEVGRQRPPRAARMLQVETTVDHFPQYCGVSKIVSKQRFDDIPLGICQVAWIAPPISLVLFPVLVCPHSDLLSPDLNRRQEESVKQALSQDGKTRDSFTNLATQARIGYILNSYLNIKGLVSIDIFTADGTHYHVGDTLDTANTRQDVRQHIYKGALASSSIVHWAGVEDNVNGSSSHR